MESKGILMLSGKCPCLNSEFVRTSTTLAPLDINSVKLLYPGNVEALAYNKYLDEIKEQGYVDRYYDILGMN